MGGSYNDISSGGHALYDVGNGTTTSANISIVNAVLNGPIVGAKGNIANISPNPFPTVPFTGNNNGTPDFILASKLTPTALTPGVTVAIAAGAGENYTLTPAQNETITVSGGAAGQDLYLYILTSGTTSYNLTFSTGFDSAGILATGAVSGEHFMVHFKNIGGTFYEVSRTAAM
jgi:hypothetical protein